jgi:methylphosphotriester-DNA--protein-cysteine methyltransferase
MRCPVCKADNNEAPQCRRCKADLALLVALEQRRARVMAEACACLSRGEAPEALDQASEADWLRSDGASRRLLALARLMVGDFAEAWANYAAAIGST